MERSPTWLGYVLAWAVMGVLGLIVLPLLVGIMAALAFSWLALGWDLTL